MFAARYRAIIDHLEQAIAILGTPEPMNAEIENSLRTAIELIEVKLMEGYPRPWNETDSDGKIVKLQLHATGGSAGFKP
jgi:hypothetical protein